MPPKSRKRLSASDNEFNKSPNTKKKKLRDKTPLKNVSSTKNSPVKDINQMNIDQLLALGESFAFPDSEKNNFSFSSDSDESEEFEEVENSKLSNQEIPKEGVSIILEVPHLKRKKKLGIDPEAHIRREINKVKKGIQLLMHKVHVLCWIAHIKYINSVINSSFVMKSCIELVKSKSLYPPKYSDISYLEGILKWFHKTFELQINQTNHDCSCNVLNELNHQIKNKIAYSHRDFTLMFIALLRVLGLKARVIISFQVLPLKPSNAELMDKSDKSDLGESTSKVIKKEKTNFNEADNNDVSDNKFSKKKESVKTEITKKNLQEKKETKASIPNAVKQKEINLLKKNSKKSKEKISNKKSEEKTLDASKSKVKKGVKKIQREDNLPKIKKNDDVKNCSADENDDGDEEEKEEDNNFNLNSLKKKGKKILSKNVTLNHDESVKEKKKCENDVWAEVFVEAEEKWISVDVLRKKVHCTCELYSRATHPVLYVIAGNNDCTLKDVTKRYVPHWHSDTKKKRVDENWWNQTMKPYLPSKNAFDQEEDDDIARQLHDQPLPLIFSEYKDHPLYALKRHLLKFEAIYPPDAPTLGFVRGEAVYARECVHTLHSREMWYKQARVVRLKEEPYKVVKARPKYDRMSGDVKKDLPLELFGVWQTENYIPPVAVDGKVPRNAYGNVDLFKPCMLPLGTVHLQIPALNKIAKKLGIDCAPATVGFDFHSGGSHPVFEGFVVCEEYKDVLLDAWNKEIDESAKKNEEKKEKRIYSNWKRLVRGLFIREKLKLKYSFGETSGTKNNS